MLVGSNDVLRREDIYILLNGAYYGLYAIVVVCCSLQGVV